MEPTLRNPARARLEAGELALGVDASLRRYIAMGVRLVIGGADLGFMMSSATARAGALRACL